MKKGKCAKVTIRCTVIAVDGKSYVGENWCANPQEVCPRKKGEGYEKCKTVCQQLGHAEECAVVAAGSASKGGNAFLEGHTYYCWNCQHILFNAGISGLHLTTEGIKNDQRT